MISTASSPSSSAPRTGSAWCAIRSPASPPSWPRPTSTSPSARVPRAGQPARHRSCPRVGARTCHRLLLGTTDHADLRSSKRAACANSTPHPAARKGQTNMSAWEIINPKGSACHCRRAGRPDRGDREGLDRLLLRRHEQAGDRAHRRLGRAGRGGKHDVGHASSSKAMPASMPVPPAMAACWSSRATHLALRHFDEGHRHRRARQHRPHVRLHGAIRATWWCCGDAGEALGDSPLRGAAVRARFGQEPGRRLHRKGDAARASGTSGRPAGKAGADDAKPEEFKRYGSARKLYNFNIDNAIEY
jgi:hypothetical protein